MDHIIVGYDGSTVSAAAGTWAADEAVRRGTGLTVVCCDAQRAAGDVSSESDVWSDVNDVTRRPTMQASVAEFAAELAESHPGLAVNGCSVRGRPHQELVGMAERSNLLVVGSTGASRSAEPPIGSVTRAVLHESPCPVVVVPGARATPEVPHVVVAVDGGDRSASALDWSIDEADLMHGELAVLHAWSYPYGDSRAWAEGRDIMRVDASQQLDKAVDRARTRGGSNVDGRLVEGHPASAVISGARDLDADLIVVGTRERFAGQQFAVLGSVAEAVVGHASCPVAVIRENLKIQR